MTNVTVKLLTLIPSLLAAINTALIAFNVYHFQDAQIQAIDTVISVVVTVLGIPVNHIVVTSEKPPDSV